MLIFSILNTVNKNHSQQNLKVHIIGYQFHICIPIVSTYCFMTKYPFKQLKIFFLYLYSNVWPVEHTCVPR